MVKEKKSEHFLFLPPILDAWLRVHLADNGRPQPISLPLPGFLVIRNQIPAEQWTEIYIMRKMFPYIKICDKYNKDESVMIL